MAEGLLRLDAGAMFTVESAGVEASFVRPQAIAAMNEIGNRHYQSLFEIG
jgi:protein-tyrosine-phosphatase